MENNVAQHGFLQVAPRGSDLILCVPDWPALHLGPLASALTVDGRELRPTAVTFQEAREGGRPIRLVVNDFAPAPLKLILRFSAGPQGGLVLRATLVNLSGSPITLNRVALLAVEEAHRGELRFGQDQERCRIYQDGGYVGAVRPWNEIREVIYSRPEWLLYNPTDRRALLVGYLTFERWNSVIMQSCAPQEGAIPWGIGFDGGDTLVDPGETELEQVVLLLGQDPDALLATYGELVQRQYAITPPARPPVTWCSWYPYRLGVSEERCLANAALGAQRLKALGLETMLLDLGWEEGYLPSAFRENDQFSHGLQWLAERLREYGLKLGTWVAPFSISEFDPLVREHPEWLIQDENGQPLDTGTWFWEPHGKVYCLDLTHPAAQEWLRRNMASLAARGVRYYKTDFIGIVTSPRARRRHNPRIVAGGGLEAARIGARIIRQAIDSQGEKSTWLNCGTETAAMGLYELLYTCNDTGNTGYVGWDVLRDDYLSVACHLFKNKRWAIIQPSCLCVGLPGTLDEARVRATATFMCGGQVDIGDELISLPEERWQVLLATLPPLGQAAKVLDLFEPLTAETLSYTEMCTGEHPGPTGSAQGEAGCAWLLPLANGWDRWQLLALFDYREAKKGQIARFKIPWERLGLDKSKTYWAYEFWSGSFLGQLPNPIANPHGYRHPGDQQRLVTTDEAGHLEVAFFGPGVKLLALRETRPHPWVVGTTFHQSCGMELEDVRWDAARRALSGVVRRPAGHQGSILIAGAEAAGAQAWVNGQAVPCVPTAFGGLVVPVVTAGEATPWVVQVAGTHPA